MKNIALVLSSGGARGIAHIGVIEVLEENDFAITSIAGASIGALIGGFYASGQLEKYKKWICNLDKIDVLKLIDFTFSKQGFIKGDKLFNKLREIIDDYKLESLDIPFCAVATDIKKQEEYIFRSGSMFDAIRASIAIPTVLHPVYKEKQMLVDGGVLNPIPIDLVKRHDNDHLVAVNLNAIIDYEKPELDEKSENKTALLQEKIIKPIQEKIQSFLPESHKSQPKLGLFDLMNKSFDLTQDKLSKYILEKYPPDLLVDISRQACSTFEFYRANEMIAEGRRACKQALQNKGWLKA